MTLIPLHNPADGVLKVVGLMSGSGSNIRKILERQRKMEKLESASPFEIVAIFSNDARSKALEIGADFDLPVVARDMRAWYARRGEGTRNLDLRKEYDGETVKALMPFEAKVAAYGGYMAIATEVLIDAFTGVNVHPADLSMLDESGKRKYTGDHAVRDAILAGEETISSSTHLVAPKVDMGGLLMISSPMEVVTPPDSDLNDPAVVEAIGNSNQDRLKRAGDWVIFPKTLEYIARGRYSVDERGNLYFDGKPIPRGLRLADL